MQVTIVERDLEQATARITFEHNDVTYTDYFNLKKVVPGTEMIFKEYNLEFTEEYQNRVIEKLTSQIQYAIESGIIRNPL